MKTLIQIGKVIDKNIIDRSWCRLSVLASDIIRDIDQAILQVLGTVVFPHILSRIDEIFELGPRQVVIVIQYVILSEAVDHIDTELPVGPFQLTTEHFHLGILNRQAETKLLPIMHIAVRPPEKVDADDVFGNRYETERNRIPVDILSSADIIPWPRSSVEPHTMYSGAPSCFTMEP